MYLPAHFAETRPEVLHALVRAYPLAAVVAPGADGLLAADHVPLLLDPGGAGAPGVLRGHVARGNPIWRDRAPGAQALAIFQGPQHYVSPNWYPSKKESGKVVPTWNYCCVHVNGTLRIHDDAAWVRRLVTELTDAQESASAHPWAVSDAPADYLQAMIGQIVGIEIVIERIAGKWKVSQNQPVHNRAGVVQGLQAAGTDRAEAMARLVDGKDPASR
jgi:transcriptional regulator